MNLVIKKRKIKMNRITLLMLLAIQIGFSQTTLPVGTFQITNDGIYNSTIASSGVARIYMGYDGTKGYINFGAHTGGGQREDILYMRGNDGNIGIGTSNPLAKLDIRNGNILIRNSSNIDNESNIMIAHSINVGNHTAFGTSVRTITQNAGSNIYGMQFFTQESYLKGQTEKVRILGNGNVGIGITNPSNKLDVNGTIHSKEVKVDMIGWSDFVFGKEYNLPTLEQVEKHIAEKGHLENIPSEEEVLKNGISLGDMNAKLLQKIEELTLYIIGQNKKIQELKKENENFKYMSERLSEIEKKLK
jgi:hypothetical protein